MFSLLWFFLFVSLLISLSEHLETDLLASQKEKQDVKNQLDSYEVFGQEFKDLAEEYARLQAEIQAKKLAVQALTNPDAKWLPIYA